MILHLGPFWYCNGATAHEFQAWQVVVRFLKRSYWPFHSMRFWAALACLIQIDVYEKDDEE